ncbi:MAG: hypothetical protein RLP44_14985 [Aggregatilineales bacterium]
MSSITSTNPNPKSSTYYLLFIGLGVALWFIFLVAIRVIGTSVFTTGNPLLLGLFVLTAPIVMGLLPLLATATKIPLNEMLVPAVIMSASAMFCDGLAVGFTELYGSTDNQIAAAAAFLLWGVSLTLIWALWLSTRGKTVG